MSIKNISSHRSTEVQNAVAAHAERDTSKLEFTTGKKYTYSYYKDSKNLVGTMDLRRMLKEVESPRGTRLAESTTVAFKAEKNQRRLIKDVPLFVRAERILDIAELVDEGATKYTLNTILDALVEDDGALLSLLKNDEKNSIGLELGDVLLLRPTGEKSKVKKFKYELPDNSFKLKGGKERQYYRTERIEPESLKNQSLVEGVRSKLKDIHAASGYISLNKAGDIYIEARDKVTGKPYSYTFSQAEVKAAKENAAKAKAEAAEAADMQANREAFAPIAKQAAAEAKAKAKAKAEAAEMQANREAFAPIAKQAAAEAAWVPRHLAKSAGEYDSQTMEVFKGRSTEIKMPYASTALAQVKEKHEHRTSDNRALMAIAALALAGIAIEAIGAGITGSEAADDADGADSDLQDVQDNLQGAESTLADAQVELQDAQANLQDSQTALQDANTALQDAQANNPDTVAQANMAAQQAYVDAYNANPSDPGMDNPGLYSVYVDDNGTMMVLDKPTEKGQEQIDAAQARYDADIANASADASTLRANADAVKSDVAAVQSDAATIKNDIAGDAALVADAKDKMAEHDKLLKQDLGEITSSLAGVLIMSAIGTGVTKYVINRSHNHSDKHLKEHQVHVGPNHMA